MQIGKMCLRKPGYIAASATARDAAAMMEAMAVRDLLVYERTPSDPIGIVTTEDLNIHMPTNGSHGAFIHVHEMMCSRLTACYHDQTITSVLRMMRERGVDTVVVFDQDERVLGLVCQDDLEHIRKRSRQCVG